MQKNGISNFRKGTNFSKNIHTSVTSPTIQIEINGAGSVKTGASSILHSGYKSNVQFLSNQTTTRSTSSKVMEKTHINSSKTRLKPA